ncbi:hypothetical protein TNCV_2435641 [Trichonephila clavipes]|nr:hypothetical protein TNCV_2435641 [Trichonephila clavipes]
MPTTRAMEAQFQTLLEKLSEMKSELTASMNANMGEMKSELTASMNANMGEVNTKLTNVNEQISANMGEVNTKLTNVNKQISANMDELNNKLTANKEELKSDLKGIGDKLTTMDKKFEEMEGRIESVENKFEDMESKLEAKIFEKVEEVSISFRSDLEKLKQKVMTGQGDEFKFQAPFSKPSIKLSTYDGKSSWQVYKTQFSIVADANQWDSQTKACHYARREMCEGLQQTPAEVTAAESVRNSPRTGDGRRGFLTWRFLTVRLNKQHEKDRHPIRAVNESDTSNSSVERLERQMRSFMNRVESLMSQKADGKKTLKCWTCGREGHLQRSCRARQGAETNKRLPEGGVGKLINGHLVGRRLPDFGKPHFQVCQISTKSTFGDTTYQHAVYVADIADPFILGLDFLKEHGFTLDFNKNELRSIHEEVTIFKIKHRTESIRQVTANENITIPPRTEIIVPGYIGNDVSFNSGLIGTAENKANGLLIASTLVDLSRKTIPVRICNVTEKPRVFQKVDSDLLENAELSPEQKSSAERLFQEFEDVFSRNSSDIGHITVTQHRIDTADHPPIKQHPRRLPFAKQEEVGTLLREMQENDIIEPSSSPWASPIVLVRKKDGSTRFCVDYRKLNDVTKKDSYPLPRIDDTLDTLSGHKWFSTLDLKGGYWQVEIHPEDREKTAFTSGQGLWQFKVMPFGLCNAPATFERLMETVLKGLTFEACLIYLDDVIIGGVRLKNIFKISGRCYQN